MADDGRIEIDAEINSNSVYRELRQMKREFKAFENQMKVANMRAMMPFRREQMKVQQGMLSLANEMGNFSGTTAEFMAQVNQLGADYKSATDNMINANRMLGMSIIQTAGQMMNMTSQATRISQNYQRMANPMYQVNRAGLAVANSLNQIANRGNAAVLALRMLGPNASMKQLNDMQMMINQGVMRFQQVAMGALIVGGVVYAGLHKRAMETNKTYKKVFAEMNSNLLKAIQPMVDVFAMIMIQVFKFVNAIAEMTIRFNKAHPVIAKVVQGILMLLPALTLLLSPLAIGIGLINGMAAAWNSLWMFIGPAVTGMAAMSGTILLVSAVIVGLTAGFVMLYKNNKTFRDGINSSIEAVQNFLGVMGDFGRYLFAVATSGNVANKVLQSLPKSFQSIAKAIGNVLVNIRQFGIQLWGALQAAFTGDFSKLSEMFSQIAPQVIAFLVGGLPGIIITAARYIPAIAQGLNSNVGIITTFFQTFIKNIVNVLTVSLPQLIQAGLLIITSLVNGLMAAIPTVLPIIISVVTSLLNQIVQNIIIALPILLNAGLQIIMALINGIVTALPQILTTAINIIMMLVQSLTAMLPQIITAGVSILVSLIDGITSMLPTLITMAIYLIQKVADMLIQNLPKIIDAGIKLIVSLVNGIVAALPKLITLAVDLIVKVASTLIDNLPKIINAGVKLLTALIKGIIQILPQLISAAIRLVVEIVKAIIQNLPQLISAGGKLILALIKGIVQLAGALWNAMTGTIIPKIKDALMKVDLFRIGVNIIQGLINGIGNMAGAVKKKVESIASAIKDKLSGLFRIGSPSKWMRDMIGKNMMIGWQIGIDKEKASTLRKTEEMASWMTPDRIIQNITPYVNASVNATRQIAPSNATPTSGGITQQITINSPTPLSPSLIKKKELEASRRLAMEWGMA